jgi:hypothetical protein
MPGTGITSICPKGLGNGDYLLSFVVNQKIFIQTKRSRSSRICETKPLYQSKNNLVEFILVKPDGFHVVNENDQVKA